MQCEGERYDSIKFCGIQVFDVHFCVVNIRPYCWEYLFTMNMSRGINVSGIKTDEQQYTLPLKDWLKTIRTRSRNLWFLIFLLYLLVYIYLQKIEK